jgi:hypothetical protein
MMPPDDTPQHFLRSCRTQIAFVFGDVIVFLIEQAAAKTAEKEESDIHPEKERKTEVRQQRWQAQNTKVCVEMFSGPIDANFAGNVSCKFRF